MEPAELAARLSRALERSGEPEAEAYARWTRRGFARFANGNLGQHMLVEEPRALLRVARGRRVAEATTTQLDERSLDAAFASAATMALSTPEDPDFPGFTRDDQPEPERPVRFALATADTSADERVRLLKPSFEAVSKRGLLATGSLELAQSVEAVATTHGLERSHRGTLAAFKVWAVASRGAGGATGHGQDAAIDVGDLDLEGETERAVGDALRNKNPLALEPGDYDVVLEPPCVAELMEWLAFIAFGARELHRGSSPLAGRIGEVISGPALTVVEDPTGDLSFACPFDREGVTRRRVELIDRGTARGVVYDRLWAARFGTTSNGGATASALGEPSNIPTSLVVGNGDANGTKELIASVKRGLYVRRLHYVNGMLEPRRAVMTGLTRDGLFLIENGKLGRAVGNMRFTDSVLEAFERVDGLTRQRQLGPTWWSDPGSVAAPAVLIRRLRFTGGSQRLPDSLE